MVMKRSPWWVRKGKPRGTAVGSMDMMTEGGGYGYRAVTTSCPGRGAARSEGKALAERCAADPGPRLILYGKKPGSRVCSASLRATRSVLRCARDTGQRLSLDLGKIRHGTRRFADLVQ